MGIGNGKIIGSNRKGMEMLDILRSWGTYSTPSNPDGQRWLLFAGEGTSTYARSAGKLESMPPRILPQRPSDEYAPPLPPADEPAWPPPPPTSPGVAAAIAGRGKGDKLGLGHGLGRSLMRGQGRVPLLPSASGGARTPLTARWRKVPPHAWQWARIVKNAVNLRSKDDQCYLKQPRPNVVVLCDWSENW
jgi:hypothetical protein